MNRKLRYIFGAARAGRWLRRRAGFTPGDWFWTACAGWFLAGLYSWRLGRTTVDIQLHDTYFVIEGFHFFDSLTFFFGVFAFIYSVYPRLTEKPVQRAMAMIQFWVTLLGLLVLFSPISVRHPGLADMPRRYMDIELRSTLIMIDEPLMVVLIVILIAQGLFLANLVYSLVSRRKSVD